MTSHSKVLVVKVGGSLFDIHGLSERIGEWMSRNQFSRCIFIAGGGPLVDHVRQTDRRLNLGQSSAHWMAVRAMHLTSRNLARIIPWAEWTDDFAGLRTRRGPVVFDPEPFLKGPEPTLPGVTLPASWDVTSDSIAARLAIVLRAEELILFKSVLPASGATVERASKGGYFDKFFPRLSHGIRRIRCVDLRARELTERTILASSPKA